MSPLRDGDLTPELRKRLAAAGIATSSRQRAPLSRKGAGAGDARARCHECGLEDTYPVVERHVDADHGGGRIDTVLDAPGGG